MVQYFDMRIGEPLSDWIASLVHVVHSAVSIVLSFANIFNHNPGPKHIFSCLPFEDIAGSSAWCLIWLSLIFQKHAPCRGVLCHVLSDGRVFRSAKQTQLYVHVCQIQILIYRNFIWIFNIFAETLRFKLLYNHML